MFLLCVHRLAAPLTGNSGHHQHQQQMSQSMSQSVNQGLGGNAPLVMPVFPMRSAAGGQPPHGGAGGGSQYSPYSPSRYATLM